MSKLLMLEIMMYSKIAGFTIKIHNKIMKRSLIVEFLNFGNHLVLLLNCFFSMLTTFEIYKQVK